MTPFARLHGPCSDAATLFAPPSRLVLPDEGTPSSDKNVELSFASFHGALVPLSQGTFGATLEEVPRQADYKLRTLVAASDCFCNSAIQLARKLLKAVNK